jgi:ParB-like chromosome segregation protein Spo0J
VQIKSESIELVSVDALIPHPKNMHNHPPEQIERLCKLIEYQGFRTPLTVQKGTNLIVTGHGRLMAAKKLGMEKVPVTYQEFDDEAQLYAHIVADNAIGKDTWATLDLSQINLDIQDLGPELDIDMLGLKDFHIEPMDAELPDLGDGSDPDIQQVTFTISNEQKDFLDQAMDKAKKELDCSDEINQNQNGNILGAIMRHYVNS